MQRMARKKVKLSPEETSAVAAASPSPAPSETQPFAEQDVSSASVGRRTKPRFSVPLTEDGAIDLEACRQEQLAKLRALLSDPRTVEAMGLKAPLPDEIFSDEDIFVLLDLIGGIEGIMFTLVGKIDSDIATRHAIWQPNEKAVILKPAKAVLAKNAGSLGFFLRWRDEITLSLLFVAITRAKFQGAKHEQGLRAAGLIPPAPQTQPQTTPASEPEKTNGKEFLADEKSPVQ